jgi:RNA polymerase sigma factor (sigma-70 family)
MCKAASNLILRVTLQVVEDLEVREASDRDLLQRFSERREAAAFHALLRRHGPMVFDVCRGVLGNEANAEDAFQATFLILARKAASIRKAASVGSWLHSVAYRTALQARAQEATRKKSEAHAPVRQVSELDDLTWREVRAVLHEELNKLPERYREALVMCYMESKTQDQAAAHLGLAKSTLASARCCCVLPPNIHVGHGQGCMPVCGRSGDSGCDLRQGRRYIRRSDEDHVRDEDETRCRAAHPGDSRRNLRSRLPSRRYRRRGTGCSVDRANRSRSRQQVHRAPHQAIG